MSSGRTTTPADRPRTPGSPVTRVVEHLDKITSRLPGGERRAEQAEMCRAVAEALVTQTHLVVQAGTGTGKSLAYLVPAALSGKKVVVATATKALQDQLAGKDLPLVGSGLGVPARLSFAVLKGRSNYICRQRVSEVGAGGIQPELGDHGEATEIPSSSDVGSDDAARALTVGLTVAQRRGLPLHAKGWSRRYDASSPGPRRPRAVIVPTSASSPPTGLGAW